MLAFPPFTRVPGQHGGHYPLKRRGDSMGPGMVALVRCGGMLCASSKQVCYCMPYDCDGRLLPAVSEVRLALGRAHIRLLKKLLPLTGPPPGRPHTLTRAGLADEDWPGDAKEALALPGGGWPCCGGGGGGMAPPEYEGLVWVVPRYFLML